MLHLECQYQLTEIEGNWGLWLRRRGPRVWKMGESMTGARGGREAVGAGDPEKTPHMN
jgi:hypothetical protein